MPVPSGVGQAGQARRSAGRSRARASATAIFRRPAQSASAAIATAVAVINRTPPSATAPCALAHTTNSNGIGQWRSRTRQVSSSGTAGKLTRCGRGAQALGSSGSRDRDQDALRPRPAPPSGDTRAPSWRSRSAAPNSVSAGIPPSRKDAYDTAATAIRDRARASRPT